MPIKKPEFIFPDSRNKPTSSVQSPEIASTVSGTSEKVNALAQTEENPEDMTEAMYERLNGLWDELRPALDAYLSMFNEEFGNEECSYMNIEMPFPGAPALNADNVEIGSIFSDFDPKDPECVALYEGLLKRLKQKKDAILQAHLLGYIDLLNVYVASKVEEGTGKHDSSKNFETDGFLNIVFGNPKLNPSYRNLVKKVFDLIDTERGLMVASSMMLHQKHGRDLSPEDKETATIISKLFE